MEHVLGPIAVIVLLIILAVFLSFLLTALSQMLLKNTDEKDSKLENYSCPCCGTPASMGHAELCPLNFISPFM